MTDPVNHMRWIILTTLAVLLFPASASGQMAGPGASMPCEWRLATAGGTTLGCPLGGIQNVVDLEGGTAVYENGVLDRGKLRLNISGGEAGGVREVVALSPDVGGGVRVYDGRKHQLASFLPAPEYVDFYAPVRFRGPVMAGRIMSRGIARQRAVRRLSRRVARLEARVAGLRSVLRRHLNSRP